MKDVELTFAIPFHQGLDYLRIAIESVRQQSEANWQLVVCDDGDEAEAEALVASYADSRIVYRRNSAGRGMVDNWNYCLEQSETDLVTLLHADDRVRPNYARLMLGLAHQHEQAAAFFCGASIIDALGKPRFSFVDAIKRVFVPRGSGPMPLQGEGALRALMAGNFIMCPTLCYRRSVLGTRSFSNDWRQVQDLEFSARLLLEGERLIGARDVAYEYRRHPEAATARHSANMLRFDEEFRLFEQVAKLSEAAGWKRAARTARSGTIIKLHLVYRALGELLSLRPTLAAEKIRFLVRHW